MSKYQALKGMHDILPGEVEAWQDLESKSRYFFEAHGFEEIRTPVVESAELFTRSMGEASDVVHKQMYTFDDRGGRTVTLRPEMTASVVRAAVENGMLRASQTARLYYMGPMFRAERPQKGRQRQFHQLGAEILNAKKIDADVEIVALTSGLLKFFAVPDFEIRHNYLGSDRDRASYGASLKEYFSGHHANLCEDCHYRIEKNVLRVLDCKAEKCQPVIAGAPAFRLSAESEAEYKQILDRMESLALPAKREPRLVRGLDYYSGLVFEVVAKGELGSQDAVAAGGRYDGLIESLGGPKEMGATGFAAGMERVLLARGGVNGAVDNTVYVATLGAPGTEAYYEKLMGRIFATGRKVKRDARHQSLGDHLKKADKLGIRCVLIVGEDEMKGQAVTVKDLKSKTQDKVPVEKLASYLIEKF